MSPVTHAQDGIGAEPVASANPPSNAPDPLIGRLLADRFLIQSLLARGGMGKVYRAEQAPLGRACAVKVLNPKYVGDHDPDFARRFFLEATIASKLTHPNTVTVFDYGQTTDGIFYMAMELLEGETLHRAIKTAAPFTADRVAHIGRQICRSLREAHAHGVIHRDLKPANIFLTEHGDEPDFVKVLDFGLVKNIEGPIEDLTETGLFMGSPKYMAPEAIRGDSVDGRADVYSLGVILYEMTCGKVPFDRSNSLGTLMAHVNDPPPPLEESCPGLQVPPELAETIFACLEKDPNHRIATMEEALIALKQLGPSGSTNGLTGEFRSVQPPSVRMRSSHPPPSISGAQVAKLRSSSHMQAAAAADPDEAETLAGNLGMMAAVAMPVRPSMRARAAAPVARTETDDKTDPTNEIEEDPASAASAVRPIPSDRPSSVAVAVAATAAAGSSVAPTAKDRLGASGTSGTSGTWRGSSSQRRIHPAMWSLAGAAMMALGAALWVSVKHSTSHATSSSQATGAAPTDLATTSAVLATTATSSVASPPSATVDPNAPATINVTSLPQADVMASFHVTSDPAGASVREDGSEICTATPCDLTFKGAGAASTATHKLTVLRYGYRPETATVTVSDGTATVHLTRAPSTPSSPSNPTHAGNVGNATGAAGATPTKPPAPNGFKDLPY